MTMVEIPSGTFIMGDVHVGKATPHRVTITKSFFASATEVRVDQFQKFLKDFEEKKKQKLQDWKGFHRKTSPTEDCPIQQMSWVHAILFCNWLGELEGCKPCYRERSDQGWEYNATANGYRLLTEAEWEFACRAGTTTRFSFGNDPQQLIEHGIFMTNSSVRAWPVARRLPNAFGLFDTHGNVAEWCWDWYRDYDGDEIDPHGPSRGAEHVIRGGGFPVIEADWCSSGAREKYPPDKAFSSIGFRVACYANQ
jgi:formylglycine-generating enzyme required for sulfatase activity